jgi:hypothetical protein
MGELRDRSLSSLEGLARLYPATRFTNFPEMETNRWS